MMMALFKIQFGILLRLKVIIYKIYIENVGKELQSFPSKSEFEQLHSCSLDGETVSRQQSSYSWIRANGAETLKAIQQPMSFSRSFGRRILQFVYNFNFLFQVRHREKMGISTREIDSRNPPVRIFFSFVLYRVVGVLNSVDKKTTFKRTSNSQSLLSGERSSEKNNLSKIEKTG